VTLIQKRDVDRFQQRIVDWEQTRHALAQALRELLPNSRVIVFGSLNQRGVFNRRSDIDIALFEEPFGRTPWALQADLEERLHRPIDLVLLSASRLREKILREGEIWTT
jgi:predicted nucleotidyltransferase